MRYVFRKHRNKSRACALRKRKLTSRSVLNLKYWSSSAPSTQRCLERRYRSTPSKQEVNDWTKTSSVEALTQLLCLYRPGGSWGGGDTADQRPHSTAKGVRRVTIPITSGEKRANGAIQTFEGDVPTSLAAVFTPRCQGHAHGEETPWPGGPTCGAWRRQR